MNYYINHSPQSGGVGALGVILIVNIILKFFNLINWSWWIVLWPLWVSIFLLILILIIFGIIFLCSKWF